MFPKAHLQRPPNSHFRQKIQHFSDEDTHKKTPLKVHKNTPFDVKNLCFFGEGT